MLQPHAVEKSLHNTRYRLAEGCTTTRRYKSSIARHPIQKKKCSRVAIRLGWTNVQPFSERVALFRTRDGRLVHRNGAQEFALRRLRLHLHKNYSPCI